MKNSNTTEYRVVQIRERMTVDLETTLILKKKIIRPIRSLFRKKRKIYRFLFFRELFFGIDSDPKRVKMFQSGR